eukprot:7297248-Ditylum_brightwellii.AAC.1
MGLHMSYANNYVKTTMSLSFCVPLTIAFKVPMRLLLQQAQCNGLSKMVQELDFCRLQMTKHLSLGL